MESCCSATAFPLLLNCSTLLHLQSPSHISSSFHWRKPINSLSSEPVSLLSQKPTSEITKSRSVQLNLERNYYRNAKVDSELKWVLNKTDLENISISSNVFKTSVQTLWRFVELKRIDEARELYFKIRGMDFDPGVVLETALIDLSMKFGQVGNALQVFEKMSERNVVTWTSVIAGCFSNNRQELGFSFFLDLMESGVLPNDYTFNVILQACTDLAAVSVGQQVHALVIKVGFECHCRIDNCLIDFYSKCHLIDDAQIVFIRMLEPDLVSFTSMIVGFCKNGFFEAALRLFNRMRWLGLDPSEHTITSILSACDSVIGNQIHAYMIKTLLHQSVYSAGALIEYYSKRNCIYSANLVFKSLKARNVVTWSLMISCFLQNGLVGNALNLFREMLYSEIRPNEFTFATVIGVCGLCSESIGLGQQLHGLIVKLNMGSDVRIFNPLLTMYARNGKVEELSRVFEKTKDPDTVSWCAAISGYSQNGLSEKSARLLCVMHKKGVQPNEYGFSSALASCANLALLDQGRQFHGFALKLGCDFDVCVGNALVNMYAKCGSINDARLAFNTMPVHDVMSWNTIIHGYALHGCAVEALQVFDEMDLGYVEPNDTTFVGVLSACNHVGYVEEALNYFRIMDSHYGVAPSISHYACLIDMMGRAGRLDEAAQIITQMPFEPDAVMWKTLLGACRVHKNLELGKFAAERAIELSPLDSAIYVLLSNLYAVCGKQEDADHMRQLMEERGVKKDSGYSWIEISSEVHAFTARDRSHPRAGAIYSKLNKLLKEMKEHGYSPDLSLGSCDL